MSPWDNAEIEMCKRAGALMGRVVVCQGRDWGMPTFRALVTQVRVVKRPEDGWRPSFVFEGIDDTGEPLHFERYSADEGRMWWLADRET